MPPTRAMAVLSVLITTTLTMTVAGAQQSDSFIGDPERGRYVYRSVGYCGNCHGWPGDGITGTMLQAPRAPSLRKSKLDAELLYEVIRCGIPTTAMPYHGRTAYKSEPCFGLVLADFPTESPPRRGKTFSDKDIAHVVAFLQAKVIGRGEPTFEECADFYDNPNASACRILK